jgi:YspA, cpYpsA-related SLOG family
VRVLVTGSRVWDDRDLIRATLDGLEDVAAVIEGCASGADRMAEEWAADRGVVVYHHPARWSVYGRAAGPIRNLEMLDDRPDLVVAFHSDLRHSRGTADMVSRARKRGVEVRVVSSRATEAT